ncbi:MAG: hypothetical protein QOJ25_264 [Solirubrobacteraceae bacterium]|jgi:hypothetical protein|nr:hypothetical protein [Solirubrobacteraceae bacterium]
MVRDRVVRGVLSSAALLGVAGVISGCGSSAASSTSGADPGTVVPAGALLYVSAVVRPSGALKTGAVDAAREITHLSDPFGSLVHALSRTTTSNGTTFDYQRDIAPWLGSRVGAFFDATGTSGLSHPVAALVADSTDATKAMAFIDTSLHQDAHGGSVVSRTDHGINYDMIDSGRLAGAIVNGFAVYGTEVGVREVITTATGGPALTASSTYQSSGIANAPGALGVGYMNFDSLTKIIAASAGAQAGAGGQGSPFPPALSQIGLHSIGMALSASRSAIALDLLGSLSKTASGGQSAAATTVATLPGDAWLGLGLGNLGTDASRILRQFTGAGLGSPLAGALLSGLDSRLHGLRIERDILPWLGNSGLFLSGTSLQTLGGAIVIQSKNPAASKAAVPRIAAALRGLRGVTVRPASVPGADAAISLRLKQLPFPIYVVDGQGRFAIGLGLRASEQALHPSSTLASSALYGAASAELGPGLKPTLVLSVPAVAALVLPQLPAKIAAQVKPYLQAFTVLTLGARHAGTQTATRLAVGLH